MTVAEIIEAVQLEYGRQARFGDHADLQAAIKRLGYLPFAALYTLSQRVNEALQAATRHDRKAEYTALIQFAALAVVAAEAMKIRPNELETPAPKPAKESTTHGEPNEDDTGTGETVL